MQSNWPFLIKKNEIVQLNKKEIIDRDHLKQLNNIYWSLENLGNINHEIPNLTKWKNNYHAYNLNLLANGLNLNSENIRSLTKYKRIIDRNQKSLTNIINYGLKIMIRIYENDLWLRRKIVGGFSGVLEGVNHCLRDKEVDIANTIINTISKQTNKQVKEMNFNNVIALYLIDQNYDYSTNYSLDKVVDYYSPCITYEDVFACKKIIKEWIEFEHKVNSYQYNNISLKELKKGPRKIYRNFLSKNLTILETQYFYLRFSGYRKTLKEIKNILEIRNYTNFIRLMSSFHWKLKTIWPRTFLNKYLYNSQTNYNGNISLRYLSGIKCYGLKTNI